MAVNKSTDITSDETIPADLKSFDFKNVQKTILKALFDLLVNEKLPATDELVKFSTDSDQNQEIEEQTAELFDILEIIYDKYECGRVPERRIDEVIDNIGNNLRVNKKKIRKVSKNYEKLKSNENLLKILFHNYHPVCGQQNDAEMFEKIKKFSSKNQKHVFKELCVIFEEKVVPRLENFHCMTWSSLNDDTRLTLTKSFANFGGFYASMREIFGSNGMDEVMKELSVEKIQELMLNGFINISKIEELNDEFYLDRSFLSLDVADNACHNEIYVLHEDVIDNTKYFNDLKIELKKTKIFIVADAAGSGKTTTLKYLTRKLKESFKGRWICYLDARMHENEIQKLSMAELTVETLKSFFIRIFNLTDFDAEIFKFLLINNKVVILWDHIDDSLQSKILEIVTEIYKSTENLQVLATRFRYAKKIGEIFQTTAYRFIPFKTNQIEEYFDYIVGPLSNPAYLYSHPELLKFFEFYGSFNADTECEYSFNCGINIGSNILMFKWALKMFINMHFYDSDWKYENFRFFEAIFKQQLDLFDPRLYGDFSLDKVIQANALKQTFDHEIINSLDLVKKFDALKPKIPSIHGIYASNNEDSTIEFQHEAFKRFFVIQFIDDNIFKFDIDFCPITESEAYRRTNLVALIANKFEYRDVNYFFIGCAFHRRFNSCSSRRLIKLITKAGLWSKISRLYNSNDLQSISKYIINTLFYNKLNFWKNLLEIIQKNEICKEKSLNLQPKVVRAVKQAKENPPGSLIRKFKQEHEFSEEVEAAFGESSAIYRDDDD